MENTEQTKAPDELRGTISAIREKAYRGARYYELTIDLHDGMQLEYQVSVAEIRKMKDHCSIDQAADLIGRPMVLKNSKK